MKHGKLVGYSMVLLLTIQGCGSSASKADSDNNNKQKHNIAKISPVARGTLTPSQIPDPEVGSEDKESRFFSSFISADKISCKENESINISLKDMPSKYDWIGLFHKDDKPSKKNLLNYAWTGDMKDGKISFSIKNILNRHNISGLPSGGYKICAFTRAGGFVEIGKSIPIIVEDNSQDVDNDAILKSNITINKENKTIDVKGLEQFYGDWVGLSTKSIDGVNQNQMLYWEWVNDDGEVTLKNVPSGQYELSVHDYDNDVPTSAEITVQWGTADMKLSTYQTSFLENEDIVVHFDGMAGTEDQWIGIFPVGADNDYDNVKSEAYPDSYINGDITLKGVPSGEYEIRAFNTEHGATKASLKITVTATANSSKVALFADEHDPHNRLLVVDYDKMELLEEISVEGSKTHHADVVGDVDSAEHILMIPKGSKFINVYTVADRKFVKKINLPFKPRSADAYNVNKNLVLLPSSTRPAAVLIDTENWNVVGTAGMNVSCDLKFLDNQDYHPWYYKNVVYKNKDVKNPNCSAPDFGGTQISGHPAWLDSNHFAVLDRANRIVHVYKLDGKKSNGTWKIKLTDSFPVSTSLHQLIPSGNQDNIFYGMTEGNGNGDGIAPVVYKWKFKHGRLIELAKTDLITTKTIDKMKNVGAYDSYTAFWSNFKTNKSYYKFYYPTCCNKSNYFPGNFNKYNTDFLPKSNNFFQNKVGNFQNYFVDNTPLNVQEIFKSLGGHNLYISPEVDGVNYLWAAVASGQTFVINANSMDVTSVVKSDKGAGHVNFQQNGKYAVITNHKSVNVTIADYKTQKFVKNVALPYEKENIFSVFQSHSPYVTRDDKYFHNTWTDGGVFFRINLDTLTLDDKSVYTGGIPIQGNYFPNYTID